MDCDLVGFFQMILQLLLFIRVGYHDTDTIIVLIYKSKIVKFEILLL